MTTDEFEQVRKKIMAQGFPSWGDNLTGTLEEFRYFLEQSAILTAVRIGQVLIFL